MAQPLSNRHNAKVIREVTPDGTLFLFVDELDDGTPFGLRVQIGKSGSAFRAWLDAFSRIATLAMAHGATLEDIITEISNITSDKIVYTMDKKIPIRSGPDGIVVGLMAYNRERYREAQLPPKREHRRGSYLKNPRE